MATFPATGLTPGRRYFITGAAGSGKSFLSKYIILRSNGMRWVVLDTKHDEIFNHWGPVDTLLPMKALASAWKRQEIVVLRPRPDQSSPDQLDSYCGLLHDNFDHFGLLIDELYQVAPGAHPRAGVTGLITRGRVRRQTVLMGAQRPTNVPLFCLTECNGFIIMRLLRREDRKRMAGLMEDEYEDAVMARPEPRWWQYYDPQAGSLRLYPPVAITQAPVAA